MRLIKLLFGLAAIFAVGFLALAFIVHNPSELTIDVLFGEEINAPVYLWLIGCFVLGGLFGLIVSSVLIAKERAARLRAERRLESTSKMISGYIS